MEDDGAPGGISVAADPAARLLGNNPATGDEVRGQECNRKHVEDMLRNILEVLYASRLAAACWEKHPAIGDDVRRRRRSGM